MENNNYKKDTQILKYYTQNSTTCECGHRMYISNKHHRLICNWCGRMVYRNKQDEFKNKLMRLINL